MSAEPLVTVRDVSVEFAAQNGVVRALDGVSMEVFPGETVAVVGESGCGKTTLARAILGLQPVAGGRIVVEGHEVHGTSRGLAERVGIVWQDPYASLNPKWKVGRSVAEPLRIAKRTGDVGAIFSEVGLDPAFVDRFPHQLSGGQRQRVAIGRALALRPPLVIFDEPTAALDLSIRAQILNLLRDLQEELGCAFLYISHDLTTVRFLADRVAVMYLGRIVEAGPTAEVFENPRHPYTRALMDSAPTLEKLGTLPEPLEGEIPDPTTRFPGCRFAGRCVSASPACAQDPAGTTEGLRVYFCHNPVNVSTSAAVS
ncbi:MAG: ABC transporter ATP-binding protein [Fimbriimonadaceae bacterium]|nr:ABC transporter ATP-binding protein [Fimbriimonadaceae bacterium]